MYTFDVPEILWEAGFDLLEVREDITFQILLILFNCHRIFFNWEILLKMRIILMEWILLRQTTSVDSVRKVSFNDLGILIIYITYVDINSIPIKTFKEGAHDSDSSTR